MNPLQSRKQLLILESELNRAQLHQECGALADEVGSVAERAKSFNAMAAPIISLVAAVGAFPGSNPGRPAAQSSWLQKISSGVKLASTVWQMFHPPGSGPEK